MITNYLKEIIREKKQKGANELYLRSAAKEYIQIIILQYIYTNPEYNSNLIFTGGTCLRHLFGLERLSEDLDFDLIESIDLERFTKQIERFFSEKLIYRDLIMSVKQQQRQILLKFPILRELDLANESESDLLYVKIDISKINGKKYKTEKTAKSKFDYNFVVLHYDLPSLFAGKINAILTRDLYKGKANKQTIKGRDFFDLLWYLKKQTPVNFEFLKEKLHNQSLTFEQLEQIINEKVIQACTEFKSDFKSDLLPFISNAEFLSNYVDNYLDEFKRYKIKL